MGCGSSTGVLDGRTLNDGRPMAQHRRGSWVSSELHTPFGKATSKQPTLAGVLDGRLGTFSLHGLKPTPNGGAAAKINQDRGLVTYPLNGDPAAALLCVFDGHGQNGEDVSEFVMWALQEQLINSWETIRADPSAALKRAFEETDTQLARSAVQARLSGTAAVVTLLLDDTLWAANTGDSRAVIAKREAGQPTEITALTEDQKPDSPAEAERIRAAGGYVSEESPTYGPPRVWLRPGEGPGLAMSRSIGDHMCARTAGPTPHHYCLFPSTRPRAAHPPVPCACGTNRSSHRPIHPLLLPITPSKGVARPRATASPEHEHALHPSYPSWQLQGRRRDCDARGDTLPARARGRRVLPVARLRRCLRIY